MIFFSGFRRHGVTSDLIFLQEIRLELGETRREGLDAFRFRFLFSVRSVCRGLARFSWLKEWRVLMCRRIVALKYWRKNKSIYTNIRFF